MTDSICSRGTVSGINNFDKEATSLKKGRVDQAMSMRKFTNKLISQVDVQSELIGKRGSVEE
jgi:hypothetical protein